MKLLHLSILAFFLFSSALAQQARFSHTVTGAGPVTVLINGTAVFSNVDYQQVTPYVPLHPESTGLIVVSGNTTVINTTITVAAGKIYTFVAVGSAVPNMTSPASLVTVEDDLQAPSGPMMARLRFFHASSNAPGVDIKADGIELVKDLKFPEPSPVVEVEGGVYTITVHPTGEEEVVYSVDVTVDGGDVYTVFVEGLINGQGANQLAAIIAIDTSYDYVTLRAAHASVDAPSVDVLLVAQDNSTVTLADNIAFKGFGKYVVVPYSEGLVYNRVALTQVGDASKVIATFDVTITNAEVATVAVTGLVVANATYPLTAVVLDDTNTAPANGELVRVKFVHLSPGTAAVDVLANGNTLFTAVDYKSQSEYAIINEGTYNIAVLLSGTNTTVLSVPNFSVAGGRVYAIYAEGITGHPNETHALSAVPSVDAEFQYVAVRAAHASPGAPAVDIIRSYGTTNETLFTGLNFGDVSNYITITTATEPTTILVVSGDQVLLSVDQDFESSVNTFLVTGLANNNTNPLTTVVFADANNAPASGQEARIRFIHASPGAPPVSVSANGAELFPNVEYKQASEYKSVAAGDYEITVNVAGGGNHTTILKVSLQVDGGKVYTIFAEGIPETNGTNALRAVPSVDAAYNYTTLRVAHAVYEAPAVDILLDNGINTTVAFTNVAYGAMTDYKTIVLENYTIKVTKAGDNQDVLFSAAPQLDVNGVYTILAAGSVAPNGTVPHLYAIADDNAAPQTSMEARIRFIHAAPGAPTVTVRANDVAVFTNVSYSDASQYKQIPATSYRIDVYVAGTTSDPVVTINDLEVEGGKVYTIVAEGAGNALEAKVFSDASYEYFQLRASHAAARVGAVNVLVDGDVVFPNATFTQTTDFVEFLSGKKRVQVIEFGQTKPVLDEEITFEVGKDSTYLIVGVGGGNGSQSLESVVLVDQWTVPTSDSKANTRFVHASPATLPVDVYFNGTAQFTNVQYKSATEYKDLEAGHYLVELRLHGGNGTAVLNSTEVDLEGGSVFSLFAEGLTFGQPPLELVVVRDFFPPPSFEIRVFQASPDTKSVDVLIEGAAQFRDIDFEENSDYKTFKEGDYSFKFVPAGQLNPTIYDTGKLSFSDKQSHSLFLVGIQQGNESSLDHVVFDDDNTLPDGNKVNIRVIHASPDAAAINLKADGNLLFSNISYKEASEYKTIDAKKYSIELLETADSRSVLVSDFNFGVAEDGAAVYTLVVEGLAKGTPPLKVVSFRDAGAEPPHDDSSSGKEKKGGKGVVIGLAVGGAILGIILLAAIGFVVYKKRQARAGYEVIPPSD